MLAILIFTVMTTWKRGRGILGDRLREVLPPAQSFIGEIQMNVPSRVSGTAVFMVRSINTTPPALIHNVRHNKVIHDCNILLQVLTEKVPHVRKEERAEILDLGDGFYTLMLRFGFNDNPDVPEALRNINPKELCIDIAKVTFFLGRETVIATERPGMAIWRENLFAFMSRNAQAATAFFSIPPNQVVEIGLQVEI
jgi:KUP system potassium uptake protein